MTTLKDIEEIVEEVRDKVRSIGIDSDETGDVYIAGEDIEDICNTLRTTLTQHHEAEVERVVEAERERILKHVEVLQRVQTFEERHPIAAHDFSARHGYGQALIDVREFLAPTKTDKQTEV